MAKRIDLAGVLYDVVSIEKNRVCLKMKGDNEVLTIWKSSPFFNIFSRIYRETRSC